MNETISYKHKILGNSNVKYIFNTSFQKFYNSPFKTGHGGRQLECETEDLKFNQNNIFLNTYCKDKVVCNEFQLWIKLSQKPQHEE